MSVTFDFRGKFVFVAGGTSGINLGVAHAFSRSGARVAVLSRSQAKVDTAVAELRRNGGDAIGFSADVRDYAKTEEALKAAHAKFGEIDVLISGAAGNFPARALDMSSNGFRAVVEIDLLGSFHVLRAAYPLLKKPGASIVNISAPQAFLPMETQMHVCAAKAGVDMVTRVGALEWGAAGVRVNSIVPGPIEDTEGMARLAPTPELKQATIESVPMQRYGSKQDIANACLWLASDAASYVSGAIIPVDGGWSLGGAASLGTNMKRRLGA